MKIVSIIGARPQFIKEAIIQKEIRKHSDITEIVIHTGQHYDQNMSTVFFEGLSLKNPDYYLNVNNKSNISMTANMMIEIEKILHKEKPDYVIVYGDTSSTLAGALTSKMLKIPLVHIEAGLRQEPKDMPEETNRVITDHISDILFAPTELAINNLSLEGINSNVYFVGDIMYDQYLSQEEYFSQDIYKKYNLEKNNYILFTLHRDFNVDDITKLKSILIEIDRISKIQKIIFPVHPRTMSRINEFNLSYLLTNVILLEPLNYYDLMGLLKNSSFVITDSGGLQKESYFANKIAFVIMPDTAWKELIANKATFLVNHHNLYECVTNIRKPITVPNLYGFGNSAQKIIDIIINDYIQRKGKENGEA